MLEITTSDYSITTYRPETSHSLPPKILTPKEIVPSQEKAQFLFELAVSSFFQNHFSPTIILEIINQIAKNPPNQENLIKQLKRQRKPGLILRSAFIALSQPHHCPPDHHRLFKLIGEVVDYFQHTTTAPIDILERVRLQLTTYNPQQTIASFTPCDAQSFCDWYTEQINYIRLALSKNNLTSEQLHRLKKTNRHFLNLYRFLTKTNPIHDPSLKILDKINDLLGSEHDLLVDQHFRDQTKYEQNFCTIAPQTKQLLNQFFAIQEQSSLSTQPNLPSSPPTLAPIH